MAKNGQDRSNQMVDQFMRIASRVKTPKVDYSIEGQMKEIEARREQERLQAAKEKARLKARREALAKEQDNWLIWKAKRDAQDQENLKNSKK